MKWRLCLVDSKLELLVISNYANQTKIIISVIGINFHPQISHGFTWTHKICWNSNLEKASPSFIKYILFYKNKIDFSNYHNLCNKIIFYNMNLLFLWSIRCFQQIRGYFILTKFDPKNLGNPSMKVSSPKVRTNLEVIEVISLHSHKFPIHLKNMFEPSHALIPFLIYFPYQCWLQTQS